VDGNVSRSHAARCVFVTFTMVSVAMLSTATPAATAICAMAVASARGGGGSYMPYAPDITIRCARPERYRAAARRARATVAGRGSPSAVMPPPRATMTPALAGGTGPILLQDTARRNPTPRGTPDIADERISHL